MRCFRRGRANSAARTSSVFCDYFPIEYLPFPCVVCFLQPRSAGEKWTFLGADNQLWQDRCYGCVCVWNWTESRGLEPRHAARRAWPAIRNRAQYHCGNSPSKDWWTGGGLNPEVPMLSRAVSQLTYRPTGRNGQVVVPPARFVFYIEKPTHKLLHDSEPSVPINPIFLDNRGTGQGMLRMTLAKSLLQVTQRNQSAVSGTGWPRSTIWRGTLTSRYSLLVFSRRQEKSAFPCISPLFAAHIWYGERPAKV